MNDVNQLVFDLNDWFPPGGEDRVAFSSRPRGQAEITFEYERDDRPHVLRLVFDAAFYFVSQPFPGPNILKASVGAQDINILELTEIGDSDLTKQCVDSWKQHTSATHVPDFRHYFIYSYEMNKLFHVVAESVTVEHDEPS